MQKYFKDRCAKNDRNFWATISPFFSDKRFRNGHNIFLRENNNVETDPSNVSELFNDYFSRVATDIGFDDGITSTSDATNTIPTQVSWKSDKYTMITKILSVLSW